MKVRSPVSGVVMALVDVPDEVFAAGRLGPGIAVDPTVGEGPVCAPIRGAVTLNYPHAFVVEQEGGSVLVHLGIDTRRLGGVGCEITAEIGQRVPGGAEIGRYDPQAITDAGGQPQVVIIALDDGPEAITPTVQPGETVAAGDVIAKWKRFS